MKKDFVQHYSDAELRALVVQDLRNQCDEQRLTVYHDHETVLIRESGLRWLLELVEPGRGTECFELSRVDDHRVLLVHMIMIGEILMSWACPVLPDATCDGHAPQRLTK